MALYQNSTYLHQGNNDEFDKTHSPGERITWSGIYRCTGCGKEVVHTNEKPLPPQNHHQHTQSQEKILWQLIVTDYTKKAT
jgi:DNA-directed RNA polymerase subunit RPC12/RpoP